MNENIITFEGQEIEMLVLDGEPMFEIYSVGMALGHVKYAKGKAYPRKDRIDRDIENAEISTVVQSGQQYFTEDGLYDFMLECRTEKCKPFRKWLVKQVLPCIRKYGFYMDGIENMSAEEIKAEADRRIEQYVLRKFGIGIRKQLTQTIKDCLEPNPKDKYIYARYTNTIYRGIFGMDCLALKKSKGLSKKDNLRDYMTDKELDFLSRAEDYVCGLIQGGITDIEMITTMISNWYNNNNK